MDPEFGPVFGASEYWHIFRRLRKRSHFGACILVLANHFRAHFWNCTIWTRSDHYHFFSNMQPENSKVSQLMLALNTNSFQTIKLKLAAFLPSAAPTGEAPCGAHVFEGFFGLENGPVKSDKRRRRCLAKKCQKTPAATPSPLHLPNPPKHSCRSVSDGVIQLRECHLQAVRAFFLQASIPRRILTKMFEAICCMNMRFAKRRRSTRASKSAFCHSVVRVMGLGNRKLCEFPQRGACTISV